MTRSDTAAGIQIENLSKSFGTSRVLTNINLRVEPGTTSCVIGPSGSGKSTLLRCITRLEEPSAGRVLIGESDLMAPHVNLNDIRSRVGIVFQNFNLFPHMSVRRNINLGLERVKGIAREEANAIAEEQLRAVGLKGFGDRLPTQLSGGQQQRVAIARALAMKPAVMLFDEVTSALDPELVKGVLEIMKDLVRSGMTTVVVTHELRFAREVAHRVVFLDKGHLIEEGAPDALFEHPQSSRLRHFLSQML